MVVALEDLLVPEVHDMRKVLSCRKLSPKRFPVLRIEEFVRADVSGDARGVQQRKPLLEEQHINVVVPLRGGAIVAAEIFDRLGLRLIEGLDADVRRIADHASNPPAAMIVPNPCSLSCQSKTLIRHRSSSSNRLSW